MTRRPLADLRHAFELDDYAVDGLTSGEFHVYGNYLGPNGVGRLVIEKGVAYGEPFDIATANLRFEGTGVRMDRIDITKGTGKVTGAAWVGLGRQLLVRGQWREDSRRIAGDDRPSRAPRSSGVAAVRRQRHRDASRRRATTSSSASRTCSPATKASARSAGRLSLRGDMLTIEMDASSKRLSVNGSGRLALTPEMDADMTLRFFDTSLDPYLRFFAPKHVAVHDRGRGRHHPHRRRARRHRSPAASRRTSTSCS